MAKEIKIQLRRIKRKLALWRTLPLVVALITAMLAPMLAGPAKTYAASPLPTYRYTKQFDASASGASAASQAVATDSNGNVYIAGQFQGTVVFDGPGGSHSLNGRSTETAFLTSYQTFVPAVTPGSSSAAAIVAPKAPNTGFGAPPRVSALFVLGITMLFSAILFAAAATLDRTPF